MDVTGKASKAWHAAAKVTKGGNNKFGNLLLVCQTLHCSITAFASAAKALKNDRLGSTRIKLLGAGTLQLCKGVSECGKCNPTQVPRPDTSVGLPLYCYQSVINSSTICLPVCKPVSGFLAPRQTRTSASRLEKSITYVRRPLNMEEGSFSVTSVTVNRWHFGPWLWIGLRDQKYLICTDYKTAKDELPVVNTKYRPMTLMVALKAMWDWRCNASSNVIPCDWRIGVFEIWSKVSHVGWPFKTIL